MEQEIWKPIHAERMRRGLLTNWSLYGVPFTTPDAPYSYVTINVFDSFENMATEPSEEIIAAARNAFVDGDTRAYGAAIAVVVLGALIVLFGYPGHAREREAMARYAAQQRLTD